MSGSVLLDWLCPRTDAMMAVLRELVEHESPSRDKAALDGLAERIAGRWARLGGHVERIANPTGGDFLHARFDSGAPGSNPPALVLVHLDTVWPGGTLARMPFRIEGSRAYGPGIYDMKASLVMVEFALAAIRALGRTLPRPVVVLATSDEEIGSPASRPLIEAEARRAAHVLVPECPLPGGGLKTARKGVGRFTLHVTGRAAHAGVEPESGASAIVELAYQILRITTLADPAAGTTLNPGVVRGGTASNVVAPTASLQLDVRVATLAEARRVAAELQGLTPATPGTRLHLEGSFDRPPMERTAAVGALFEHACALARPLGLDLAEGTTGGASDGNLTAALGVPTLDGLGTLGAGAHADHEHISIPDLAPRTALLAALLQAL